MCIRDSVCVCVCVAGQLWSSTVPIVSTDVIACFRLITMVNPLKWMLPLVTGLTRPSRKLRYKVCSLSKSCSSSSSLGHSQCGGQRPEEESTCTFDDFFSSLLQWGSLLQFACLHSQSTRLWLPNLNQSKWFLVREDKVWDRIHDMCSEGFPVNAGGSLQRSFELVPLLSENRVSTKSCVWVSEWERVRERERER